ncbi:recombinase family protein [Sabulicella glaciei]|uniref:Recombinase family protein n=1 Tax=Sabulicella glaciei TaxID=2984948 RepID=A0ABT3P1E7_9PROT|nr:recombinase family protein [Roseococcus sp. MDT2-1-1]MCW8088240.1 recombinase family protein [Roseococcus sp. MDT2-1-1]
MRSGQADIVLAESLDRLSRDQEHVAAFHKQARFAGVRIVTLAEGEASELHVGLKGTMGAVLLRDLTDKTRRGLEGRVRDGRSGGGLCYGYWVIRGPIGRDGEAERGLREIEPKQATVVRRIFADFAAGQSPIAIAIAKALNAKGIAAPRGSAWTDGALRGQARLGTGILSNDLYVGRLVWNRLRWLKDRSTGQRLARRNEAEAFVTEDVPDLRIVEQGLWERVQQRLAAAERPRQTPGSEGQCDHLWHYRQASTLLSGKVVCGVCGGPFITSGKDHMACKATVRQGICTNRTRVRRTRLEAQVLEALQHDLMQPEWWRSSCASSPPSGTGWRPRSAPHRSASGASWRRWSASWLA